MTDFDALCGFITLKDLKVVIHNVPEVVDLIGDVNAYLVLQTNVIRMIKRRLNMFYRQCLLILCQLLVNKS